MSKVCFAKIVVIIFLMIGVFLSSSPSYAQKAEEEKIQAIWIQQLVQYIRWKGRPYKNIQICTLGLDSVGFYLRESAKSNVSIKTDPDSEEISQCHFLYISESEKQHIQDILERVKDKPILTLSRIRGFAKLGGMIQFIREKNKVSLRINKDSVINSKIIIDSDLLNISDVISGN